MFRSLRPRAWAAVAAAAIGMASVLIISGRSAGARPKLMVVMDPLAKQLACACVKGYAQRDYALLAESLSKQIGLPIRIVYSEDLDKILRANRSSDVAIVVGKESVVVADAAAAQLRIKPLCRLSGKTGLVTQTGLFVVKEDDPARSLADLKGRHILFGLPDAEEKYAAALTALRTAGVPLPAAPETRAGCSDAASEIQDATNNPPPAAVISSYALPLLEGCGGIRNGSLRVLAETAPVPFITLFATDALSDTRREKLTAALLDARSNPALLESLESRDGFVKMPVAPSAAAEWPDWRGPGRHGLAPSLPAQLPATADFVWRKSLPGAGLAGIAAANGLVVIPGRDPLDQNDLFLCLRASDGEELWRLEYPAPGQLDYGQSPRATPVINEGRVYLLGAFGDLHCVALATGKVEWRVNLRTRFQADVPRWGFSAAPLIAGNKLIVNPGARKASLAALDRLSGKTLWTAPGGAAAYAAFIAAPFGGRLQIVGYDAISLGGWDPSTGRRLWTLLPPKSGDFNVPTPVAWEGKLIVATENNGTRLYGFANNGIILAKPLAESPDLAPDVNSPVVANNRLLACHAGLHCLDLSHDLKSLWALADPAFEDAACLIASGSRVLVSSHNGELLLVSTEGDACKIVSRLRVFEGNSAIYSHPALVGGCLFWRDNSSACCLRIDPATGLQ